MKILSVFFPPSLLPDMVFSAAAWQLCLSFGIETENNNKNMLFCYFNIKTNHEGSLPVTGINTG